MDRIPASELIVNNDGSIYHLDLKPGEIGDTIITVGDPDRVDQVASHFDTIRVRKRNREFKTVTGTLHNQDISVISTGIGTDCIDIVLNELDALVNVDLQKRTIHSSLKKLNFIRIGTSGTIQQDIAVDSFLLSHAAISFDGLFAYYPEAKQHESALAEPISRAFGLYNPFVFDMDSALAQPFKKDFIKGLTATFGGFYAPQGRGIRLSKGPANWMKGLVEFNDNNNKITNIEMETAGIYGLSRILGHRAISLNAILANRMTGEFSTEPQKTINKLIHATLELLQDAK